MTTSTPQISNLGQVFLRSPVLAALGSGVIVVALTVLWYPVAVAMVVGVFTAVVQWILWRGGERSLGYRIKLRQAQRGSDGG